MRKNHHINIGVAVAVKDGLLVPVVRFADNKSLSHIAAEVKDLAQKAHDKKLQPSDWEGSTFTISNLGMFGVDALAESAVIIKCRLKVRPASQWMIGREFKRRLKNRFDELGIEFPFPQQTIHFGAPGHIVLDTPEHEEERRDLEPAGRKARPRPA